MRKGRIIVDQRSPLAAYLESDDVSVEITQQSSNADACLEISWIERIREALTTSLQWYLQYICMCGMEPLRAWCSRYTAWSMLGIGIPMHILLWCFILLCGWATAVPIVRSVLFAHVFIYALLMLWSWTCCLQIHKLQLTSAQYISVFHKFQSVFMGIPVSTPLIPLRILDKRMEAAMSSHLQEPFPSRATRFAIQNLLVQFCEILTGSQTESTVPPNILMKVSQLHELRKYVFSQCLPQFIEELSTNTDSIHTLARLLHLLMFITASSIQLDACGSTSKQHRCPHLRASTAEQSSHISSSLLAKLSNARRHIAELRAKHETAAIQLWKCEQLFFSDTGFQCLSDIDSADFLADGQQLELLQQHIESLSDALQKANTLEILEAYRAKAEEELRQCSYLLSTARSGAGLCPVKREQLAENEAMVDTNELNPSADSTLPMSETQQPMTGVFESEDLHVSSAHAGTEPESNLLQPVDVLTAIVDDENDPTQSVDSTLHADARLHHAVRAHLVEELGTTLTTLAKSKVYRVRKLLHGELVDCDEDEPMDDSARTCASNQTQSATSCLPPTISPGTSTLVLSDLKSTLLQLTKPQVMIGSDDEEGF